MSARNLDPEFYRRLYPDLESTSARQLRQHWTNQGEAEERFPNRESLMEYARSLSIDLDSFSVHEYLALNPDLADSFTDPDRALMHLASRGLAEGRRYKIKDHLTEEISAAVEAYVWKLAGDPQVVAAEEAIATLHQMVKGRLPWTSEIQALADEISSQSIDLQTLLEQWCREEREVLRHFVDREDSLLHSPQASDHEESEFEEICRALSISERMTRDDWERRIAKVRSGSSSRMAQTPVPSDFQHRLPPDPGVTGQPAVSVLTSLYRSDRFLEAFLANMAEQRGAEATEFILMLVDASDLEVEQVREFQASFPRTKVIEFKERVTIYEAWNCGVRVSTAPYLTNANVDDTRRFDSLFVQSRFLDINPQVDVVFQDYFVTPDPHLPWNEVAEAGYPTHLTEITSGSVLEGLITTHSAPMWRRSLHAHVGFFDPSLKTVGDSDFWLRCLLAGRTFAKMPEMHVSYYVNPEGLSTRLGGSWEREGEALRNRYWWLLRRGAT